MEELSEEAIHESLLATKAEIRAIEDEEAEARDHQAAGLTPAEWSRSYVRLLVERRGANLMEAWHFALTAESYEQARDRLDKVHLSQAAAATEAASVQQSAVFLEVIHSPDLFSFLLGGMNNSTLGAVEAVCRTWRRRVADNLEWEHRVELYPRGYHDAPAKLKKWVPTWEGEQRLTTMGQVSAKQALMALSALAVPTHPRRPAVIAPEDLAFAVSITVDSPQTPGVQPLVGSRAQRTKVRPDAVPVDRTDETTFHTTLVCAQVLPFADAEPCVDDVFADWVGGQGLSNPTTSGMSWTCEVDMPKLLQCSAADVQQMDAWALHRAISRVYQAEYDYDSSCQYARGHGCRKGASVSISVRAIRRSDKKVVPLLERAPLIITYSSGHDPEGYFAFEAQDMIGRYLRKPGEPPMGPRGVSMGSEEAYSEYFGFLEPYGPRVFPMSDLTVQASLSPVEGELRWQLSLEVALIDARYRYAQLVVGENHIAAPADAVRRLLSIADWQG